MYWYYTDVYKRATYEFILPVAHIERFNGRDLIDAHKSQYASTLERFCIEEAEKIGWKQHVVILGPWKEERLIEPDLFREKHIRFIRHAYIYEVLEYERAELVKHVVEAGQSHLWMDVLALA